MKINLKPPIFQLVYQEFFFINIIENFLNIIFFNYSPGKTGITKLYFCFKE